MDPMQVEEAGEGPGAAGGGAADFRVLEWRAEVNDGGGRPRKFRGQTDGSRDAYGCCGLTPRDSAEQHGRGGGSEMRRVVAAAGTPTSCRLILLRGAAHGEPKKC